MTEDRDDKTATPPKPTRPCWNCGTNEWWLRDKGIGKSEWLCARCRPNPKGIGEELIGDELKD